MNMSRKDIMRNAPESGAGPDVAALAVAVPARSAAEEVAALEAQLQALKDTEEKKREAVRSKLKARAQPFIDERNTLKVEVESASERIRMLTEELVNMGWEEPRVKTDKVGWNLAKTTVAAIAKKAQRGLPEFAKDPAEWESMGGGADNPLPPEWLNKVLRGLADKLTLATPESESPKASEEVVETS